MAAKASCVEIEVADKSTALRKRTAWRNVSLSALLLALWWLTYSFLLPAAKWITYSVLHLDGGTRLGSAVEFFVFEVPKVMMLLTLVVFGVGIVRSFFTPERTRSILAGKASPPATSWRRFLVSSRHSVRVRRFHYSLDSSPPACLWA